MYSSKNSFLTCMDACELLGLLMNAVLAYNLEMHSMPSLPRTHTRPSPCTLDEGPFRHSRTFCRARHSSEPELYPCQQHFGDFQISRK